MLKKEKRLLLCVLDGWGWGINDSDNAVYLANTPFFDSLVSKYPNCHLETSGHAVGLPTGQAGNSEIGHAVIGCGRVIKTDIVRISEAIASGDLKEQVIEWLRCQPFSGSCHIIGLLSDGGVHAHCEHIEYMAKTLGDLGLKVFLHCFLDGRDAPPASGVVYIKRLQEAIAGLPNVHIATISGRFYAMDRDSNWERTKKAYDAIIWGRGDFFQDVCEYIERCYSRGVTDEFIEPAVSIDYNGARDEDGLVSCNFRADRIRQILCMLVDRDFEQVQLRRQLSFGVGMVEYSPDLSTKLGHFFAPIRPTNNLGSVLSAAGYKQLRISETEKYAHVTFFFNGGEEACYLGEDRIIVPSPKVLTYDLMPEMSSEKMTEQLKQAISQYDFIVANYPGADMVGHTGNIVPTIKAIEAIDKSLQVIVDEAIANNMKVIITADHGNAEKMLDKEKRVKFTAHTTNPVPFIVVDNEAVGRTIRDGSLADIAPTILEMLGIPKPDEMSGSSLFVPDERVV